MIKKLLLAGIILNFAVHNLQAQTQKKLPLSKSISSKKDNNKSMTLDKLVKLKTISTYTGVSSTLLDLGFYIKSKNDTYSLFTDGTNEIYYFPGEGNDGSGIVLGNAKEVKDKIAVQYMFNSKNVYDNMMQQSYKYLGAKQQTQHTEGNGNKLTVIKTSDFVFMFGENLEKTDTLNYKVFILSLSNFIE
ncbi:MAG: hypothetical protein RR623_02310 [Bacilli bacterium]